MLAWLVESQGQGLPQSQAMHLVAWTSCVGECPVLEPRHRCVECPKLPEGCLVLALLERWRQTGNSSLAHPCLHVECRALAFLRSRRGLTAPTLEVDLLGYLEREALLCHRRSRKHERSLGRPCLGGSQVVCPGLAT